MAPRYEGHDEDDALLGSAFPDGPSVGALLVILRLFADESGTQKQKSITTVAAVVLSVPRWKRLTRWWRRRLEEAGVREFKCADCTEGTGEFASWSENRRYALKKLLAGKINELGALAVGISVVRAEFEDVIFPFAPLRSDFRDPYLWAMRTCLEGVAKSEYRRGGKVACVFDEGYGRWPQAYDHFQNVRRLQKLEGAILAPFTVAPSVSTPCLQAADLLAYELRHNNERECLGIPKRYPDVAAEFTRLPIVNGIFRAAGLRGVRNDTIEGVFHCKLDPLVQRANWDAWLAWCAEPGQ